MFRFALLPALLVTLVTIPSYLLGQKLRQGDPSVFMLTAAMFTVILLASAIMRDLNRS
jgi:hypothetical protein